MSGGAINRVLYSIVIALVIGIGGFFVYEKYNQGEFGSVYSSGTGAEAGALAIDSIKYPPVEVPHTTVLFVGDIMLDRHVRNDINNRGFETVLGSTRDVLSTADLVIGNLEGPFTDYPSKTSDYSYKGLVFTFDPALAPKMRDLGFDVFGLANNHTLNFGHEGLVSTKKYLDEAGIQYFGDPNNSDAISLVVDSGGLKIGLIGYHEFSYRNLNNIFDEILKLRPQTDFIFVMTHWGVEYEKIPRQSDIDLAHKFIDLGADAVIGGHPHVVQSHEEYNGKPIYYSLGNFIFDQYFSDDVTNGLGLLLTLKRGEKPEIIEIPIKTAPTP